VSELTDEQKKSMIESCINIKKSLLDILMKSEQTEDVKVLINNIEKCYSPIQLLGYIVEVIFEVKRNE